MEIREPIALTRLARPLSNGGKVHFGSVWALHAQTKRKRHEICTTVDGDSLNIHEIQNGRTIFSHAVPPSTSFACAPTSVRWKIDGQVLRQTYFAVRDDGLSLRSVLRRDISDHESHTTGSIDIENAESPVVHVDVIPFHQKHSVIMTQADGTLTVASANLLRASSTKLDSSNGTGNFQLLAATALTLSDARKTTLKSREDLWRNISDDSAVLVAAFKQYTHGDTRSTKNIIHYGAWSISLQPGRLDAHRLFDHKLLLTSPESPKKQADAVPSFGPRASMIVLKSLQGVRRFDLTGLVPRQLSPLDSNMLGHQDIIMMLNGHALVAFQDSLRLVDAEYGFVQASLDLNKTLLRRKRKRGGSESAGVAIDFIGYFIQLGRVIIYSRSHLIACDLKLGEVTESGSSASLLVNSIGRGKAKSIQSSRTPILDIGQASKPAPKSEEWSKFREKLNKMKQANNAAGFETTILKFLRNQDDSDRKDRKTLHLSESQLNYVLLNLFDVEGTTGKEEQKAQMHLSLVAPRLVRRLSRAGVLSTQRLERALTSTNESTRVKMECGDIARSLLRGDPTYRALSAYIEGSSSTDPREQAATVKLLLSRLLNQRDPPVQPLIAQGGEDPVMAIEMAEVEVVNASALSKEGVDAIMTMLTGALTGLGTSDTKTISSILRTLFSGTEVLGLIQLLRQQLFKTGYPGSVLQPHEESVPVIGDEAPQKKSKGASATLAMDTILKVLSACVDAVGPLDLLSREESDAFIEGIIPDLFSEVALATETAEQSADVQGTLRESLRYIYSDKVKSRSAKNRLEEAMSSQHPGVIVTMYTENMEDEAANGQAGLLPLALHAEDVISKTKVRKGGGQESKRSLRHTLMLESRQKGVYSFERLVL